MGMTCPCGCGRKARFGRKDVAELVIRVDEFLANAGGLAARVESRRETDPLVEDIDDLITEGGAVRAGLLHHLHGTSPRKGEPAPSIGALTNRVDLCASRLVELTRRAATAPKPLPPPDSAAPIVATMPARTGRSAAPEVFDLRELMADGRVLDRLRAHIPDAAGYGVLWAQRPIASDAATAFRLLTSWCEEDETHVVLARDDAGRPTRVEEIGVDNPAAYELEHDQEQRRSILAQFDGPWAWVDVWTVEDTVPGDCVARCERYTIADRDTCRAAAADGWLASDDEEHEAVVALVNRLADGVAGASPQAS